MKTTLRSVKFRNSHDPKAVATKEESIMSSPGHQPHECDAKQAEEPTMLWK